MVLRSLRLSLFCGACLFAVVSVKTDSDSGLIQELRDALAGLAGEGRTYLGRLAGEQTVLWVEKTLSQVLGVVAENLAYRLNPPLQYVSRLLQSAGIQAAVHIKVTPEGLTSLAQWFPVALVSCWFFLPALHFVVFTLRWALCLLKVVMALTCFPFPRLPLKVLEKTLKNMERWTKVK